MGNQCFTSEIAAEVVTAQTFYKQSETEQQDRTVMFCQHAMCSTHNQEIVKQLVAPSC